MVKTFGKIAEFIASVCRIKGQHCDHMAAHLLTKYCLHNNTYNPIYRSCLLGKRCLVCATRLLKECNIWRNRSLSIEIWQQETACVSNIVYLTIHSFVITCLDVTM